MEEHLKSLLDQVEKSYRLASMLYRCEDYENCQDVLSKTVRQLDELNTQRHAEGLESKGFNYDEIKKRYSSKNKTRLNKAPFRSNGEWSQQLKKDLAEIRTQIVFVHNETLPNCRLFYPIEYYVKKHLTLFIISLGIIPLLFLASNYWRVSRWGNYGLVGHYFANKYFEGKPIVKIDKNIDFYWENSGPFGGRFKQDYFSIRWEGFLVIKEAGFYIFGTKADDGERLWIDDHLVISDWKNGSAEMNVETIFLSKGNHRIKMEYFESELYSSVQLYWRPPNVDHLKIIPRSNFLLKLK